MCRLIWSYFVCTCHFYQASERVISFPFSHRMSNTFEPVHVKTCISDKIIILVFFYYPILQSIFNVLRQSHHDMTIFNDSTNAQTCKHLLMYKRVKNLDVIGQCLFMSLIQVFSWTGSYMYHAAKS